MKKRTFKLVLLDTLGSVIALYFAFLLRFDFQIDSEYNQLFLVWCPLFVSFQIVAFYSMSLYARIWRYTSLQDLFPILSSLFASWALACICILSLMGSEGYPRSILFIYFIINIIFTVGSRLIVRIYFSFYHSSNFIKDNKNIKTLLLVGAGKTGDKIAREILTTSRDKYSIVGFVDDDSTKQGAMLQGVKVLTTVQNLPEITISYDEIIITAPSANGDQMRRIVDSCKKTGKRYRTVPALHEIIGGEISLALIRDVSYSDLLGREEVKLDMISIEKILNGKRVLITGAGGSIGSELVKQCLTFNPAEIIGLDVDEERIYSLNQFYDKSQSKTVLKTVLASINRVKELEKVFIENQPHIVFHAAAYKHVPIQEIHPWTAVKTNIEGTLNLTELSNKYKVDKFVLVSTDKAVNPVNVMGATKRLSEKLILSLNQNSETCFMAVRFGNVLGSSGSAIPTFQKQINEGGPITITHPEMTRYFMSIPEASQLILQCGALGRDGEIFLLQMGKPIKIVQMAKDLIRLSGLEPEVDIPIVYTGLRQGEKLYEELKFYGEKIVRTNHKKIMILKQENDEISWDVLRKSIQVLIHASDNLDSEKIQILLKRLLPSYRPNSLESNIIKGKPSLSFGIKGQA
tara:strand:- start:3536 stop:5431 length:1896 start_codon:yes stop_codon:yes gene_type:complete